MPCAPILCRMQNSNDCEHEGSYQSIERHLLGRGNSANVGGKPSTRRAASCLHRPLSHSALASYNGWYGRCAATTRSIWLQIRSNSFRGLQRQLLPDRHQRSHHLQMIGAKKGWGGDRSRTIPRKQERTKGGMPLKRVSAPAESKSVLEIVFSPLAAFRAHSCSGASVSFVSSQTVSSKISADAERCALGKACGPAIGTI